MRDHDVLVADYLRHLDLPATPPSGIETLRLLHRRHLERVPYDNVAIMLGRPEPVDPTATLRRIVQHGRAGYCFHHNGALEHVLRALGYDVVRHHGHVWTREADRDDDALNHLALEVRGLPTDDNPGGRWWADVGLGDGFLEPLPLVDGVHREDPFSYRISGVGERCWSFRHDERGSFTALEVRDRPVGPDDVAAAHRRLSTPPDGPFTRLVVAQRRVPGAAHVLRGITHDGEHTSYDAWRAALAGPLALALDDLPDDELRALHARSVTAHESLVRAGRP